MRPRRGRRRGGGCLCLCMAGGRHGAALCSSPAAITAEGLDGDRHSLEWSSHDRWQIRRIDGRGPTAIRCTTHPRTRQQPCLRTRASRVGLSSRSRSIPFLVSFIAPWNWNGMPRCAGVDVSIGLSANRYSMRSLLSTCAAEHVLHRVVAFVACELVKRRGNPLHRQGNRPRADERGGIVYRCFV